MRRNRRIGVRSSSTAIPKGASVVILGAGLAGMTAAIELQHAGYKVSVLEYNASSGRTELVAARRRRLHGARRRDAKVRVRRWPLSQSRAMAHSLSPLRNAGLLPPFRRDARALHPAQSQRLSAFRPMRSAASRSAFATSRPISTAASPSFWRRRRSKGRSTMRCRQEDQEILLEALRLLGALDKDFRYRMGEDSASHRATPSLPAAVSAPRRSRASRSGCTIF